jgi:chitin synthase
VLVDVDEGNNEGVYDDMLGYRKIITLSLLGIVMMDNSACVELLRGSQLNERVHRKLNGVIGMMGKASSSFKPGKTSDNRDEELLQNLVAKFGVHSSFVASLSVSGFMDRNLFGINHYSGNCSYDVSGFVEKDARLLDATFISLLQQLSDLWISKLMSGLGMALERHHNDESILVQAQIISHPIHYPTLIALPDGALSPEDEHAEIDPGKTYAVTTQLNCTLS